MTNSQEPPIGESTISRFWLEVANGKNVSPSVLIREDGGRTFQCTLSDACGGVWVLLTAENNNYSGDFYQVSGYWDEETGVPYPEPQLW